MLQIALFLLTSGLSRYMWSVNTSVARVIISFTVLGFLFFIGIVVAGTCSYVCPLQTPLSTLLRYLYRKMVNGRRPKPEKLPSTTKDEPRVSVPDLGKLRKQNTDDVRCISWVLWYITDPEALESAARLAGDIQWFDGNFDIDSKEKFVFLDSDYRDKKGNCQDPVCTILNPIITTFEACFDSTQQLRPGIKDRAYHSARAILQINTRARVQDQSWKYRIPTVFPSSSHPDLDPDLHHVVSMLKHRFGSDNRPILDFSGTNSKNPTHSLWMSNLFLDLTRVGSNPILKSYKSYLNAAVTNNQAVIANTLLIWYIILGGRVDPETFWADNKSYVAFSFLFIPPAKICVCQSQIERRYPHPLVRESG